MRIGLLELVRRAVDHELRELLARRLVARGSATATGPSELAIAAARCISRGVAAAAHRDARPTRQQRRRRSPARARRGTASTSGSHSQRRVDAVEARGSAARSSSTARAGGPRRRARRGCATGRHGRLGASPRRYASSAALSGPRGVGSGGSAAIMAATSYPACRRGNRRSTRVTRAARRMCQCPRTLPIASFGGRRRWTGRSADATCCAGPCWAARRSRSRRCSRRAATVRTDERAGRRARPPLRRHAKTAAYDPDQEVVAAAELRAGHQGGRGVRPRRSRPVRSRPRWPGSTCATGPTRSPGTRPHWFFGDGMVHGIRLEDGKAKWYRNRYVGTDAVRQRRRASAAVAAGRRVQPVQRLRDLARRQAPDERRGRAPVRALADGPEHGGRVRLRRRS